MNQPEQMNEIGALPMSVDMRALPRVGPDDGLRAGRGHDPRQGQQRPGRGERHLGERGEGDPREPARREAARFPLPLR